LQQLQTEPNLERLLAGARDAGIHIIFAPHGLDDHSFDGIEDLSERDRVIPMLSCESQLSRVA
jgi:hypothetical protein